MSEIEWKTSGPYLIPDTPDYKPCDGGAFKWSDVELALLCTVCGRTAEVHDANPEAIKEGGRA